MANTTRTIKDPMSRFLGKVEVSDAGCWIWTGTLTLGYGCFSLNRKSVRAHRWMYEQTFGPIPSGLVLDHLCRNKPCVNPDHLEAVTQTENVRRGRATERSTHCKRGHALTDDNIYTYDNGDRRCLACRRAFQEAARRRRGALVGRGRRTDLYGKANK